jgi:hypothetical protein
MQWPVSRSLKADGFGLVSRFSAFESVFASLRSSFGWPVTVISLRDCGAVFNGFEGPVWGLFVLMPLIVQILWF